MSEAGILLNRAYDDSLVNPDKFGKPLVLGIIGFASYATSSNPTAEVLSSTTDGTAGHVVSEQALDCTLSLTAGTITVPRGGTYRIRLNLATVSAASASGVMEFFLQKNAAALTVAKSTKLLQPAVNANFMSATVETVITLVANDAIRAVVTGTVGGIITITTGSLSVEQLADTAPMGQSRI